MTHINPLDIKIVFEDNHLIIIEKPINIPSQKDESNDMDILTILKENLKIRYNKPNNVYLGLIHRLDRPVGGLMVFAKTSKAASRLSEQIRNFNFKKTYLAVIHNKLNENSGTLINYLFKTESTNIVSVVNEGYKGSKEAILNYKTIETKNDLTLVKVELLTGRSHQIRVQFASIGNPLYGDQKYGLNNNGLNNNALNNKRYKQIALWSHEIGFNHPIQKEEIKFKIYPPKKEPWNIFSECGR